MLCDRRPDPRGLGGSQLHSAALVQGSGPRARVFAAYPAAGKLLVLRPGSARDPAAELSIGEPPRDLLSPWAGLTRALEASALALEADVFSVQAPQLAPAALCDAIDRVGARVVLTLHDHALACENHELLEAGARYCDLPEEPERCNRCLERTRRRAAAHIERWRLRQAELLERCDVVIAPSDSVLATLARIHPSLPARARRIDWGVPVPSERCDPGSAYDEPLRIAVVGVLAEVKGSERLPELLAACRGLDVEWHLFGATEGRSLAAIRSASRRVVVHGAYSRAKLAGRLVRARCAVGLLPSIVPESFSLTLSELLACGMPVIVSDLGAQRERVLAADAGWVIDPWRPDQLLDLLAALLADRGSIERRMRQLGAVARRDEAAMVDDHVRLWLELAGRGARRRPGAVAELEAKRAWALAAPRTSSRLVRGLRRGLDDLRKTEWYRDLPLRRLLPEAVRARAERGLLGIVSRKNGRK